MVTRAFSKMRTEFEKARNAALSELRKGTRWRKKSAWLFCEQDGVFIDTFIIGHRNDEKTSVTVSAKPMAIDPLFWRITGMPQNERSPLSLRANGMFVCNGVEIQKQIVSDEGLGAPASAAKLLELAEAGAEAAGRAMMDQLFSRLLEMEASAKNLIIGQYNGPTYVTALILDNRRAEAQRVIDAISTGTLRPRSSFSFDMPGDVRADFFALASHYLANQTN